MRRRLVLAIVGSVAVTLVVFGIPLGWAISEAYRDDQRLRLEAAALANAPELSEPDANLAPAEPPTQFAGIRVAYYDPSGARVAGAGPARADAVVLTALDGRNGLAERTVAIPVSRDDRVVGVVRAEDADNTVARRTRRAWLLMGGLALVILAGVAAIAAALARRLSAPVDALTDAAGRLEAGDFAVAPRPSGIRELDGAGLALAAAARRLESVLARERELTADIAHQLRTPLTALRIEIEAGAERAGGPDAERALEQVDRLETTITSLLALARDDSSAREALGVEDVVAANANAWLATAHAAGRHVSYRPEPGTARAYVSERALRQILDVLIDNALTHGRGTITISSRSHEAAVRISIADGGQPPADERIFDRRSRSASGHGIGLALARSLAEAQRGRLVLDRDQPTTTFTLHLVAEAAV